MTKTNTLWILAMIAVAGIAFSLGQRSVHCKGNSAIDAAACGAPTPPPAFPSNLPPPPPPSEPNSSHQ